MKNEDVDPAALLIAIVSVAWPPLTTAGPWSPLNTVIAGVVLTVLLAYTCVGSRRRLPRQAAERAAIGMVIGLVAAIAIAYPLQTLFSGNLHPDQLADTDPTINQATWIGLLFGFPVAVVIFCLLGTGASVKTDKPEEAPSDGTQATTGPDPATNESGPPPS
jgi:hypothetical protein